MSGGVDSSIAAYLLKEQGYDVEGVSFILEERRAPVRLLPKAPTSCCSIESLIDARKTADRIGISHTMVNLRTEFTEYVIGPFIEAYSKGLTPNPCILCNEHIKFAYLMKIANERGADFIATGHYARVKGSNVTRHSLLLKGIDPKKDQSYVLYVLKQEELSRLKLPLGEKTKDEVREIARKLNLSAAKRPESQEICFVGGRNYFRFLENLTETNGGPIIDMETGKTLGRHKGIYLYTIGQRKRLGIAAGKALYVVKIDASENAIYVGPKEAAMNREFVVEDINWLNPSVSPLLKGGSSSFRATVKIRSMMKDEPATVYVMDYRHVRVIYDEPQWAPAPGQSAVFYDGDVILGGGVIIRQW